MVEKVLEYPSQQAFRIRRFFLVLSQFGFGIQKRREVDSLPQWQ
jgi:hypothetical protein